MIQLDSRYLKYLAEYMNTTVEQVLDNIFEQYAEDIEILNGELRRKVVLSYKPPKERDAYDLTLGWIYGEDHANGNKPGNRNHH